MKKRITLLLLSVCMLFSMTAQNIEYVSAAGSPPASVSVTYEGSEIGDIIVPQNEKKTVTAVCDPAGDIYGYQWQVLVDLQSDLWVNITGQSRQSLDLYYALLSSVLDASGSGYVRCAVTMGEETIYSKPVCATVSFTPEVSFEPTLPEQPVRRPSYAPRAGDEPESQADYVYITVNYIDAVSGNPLFGSHTSQIEKGTAFDEIVYSPTFLGFAPYYYSNDWDIPQADITDPETEGTTAASAVTINFKELLGSAPVGQNITVNVYYWAVNVPYAVKYFFQNINDDYYTEQTDLYYASQAKTGTIIGDEELFEHAGTPEGFSPLYHYPESVAADGNTVFECYYDRNYYFMKFDMAGGYGVDPIYARYDMPIVVNNPTRPGYTFLGWDELAMNPDGMPGEGDGVADSVSDRIGTENKYYKALWKKADTTYTVIYWLQNAEPIPGTDNYDYSYFGYSTYSAKAEEYVDVDTRLDDAIGVEGDPAKLATLRFFELNETYSDKTVMIAGDGSTVANVYYDRKDYTLKYYYAREFYGKIDPNDRREPNANHTQICGNTSDFSDRDRDKAGTTDISTLLSYVNGNWIDVREIPALKNDNGYYTTGTEDIRHNNTDYTYYYFTVTGKYGCSLEGKWPLEALDTATLTAQNNRSTTAYFSAWNPEHHIYYGQHSEDFGKNRTIKGSFQKLDRRLLYEERFGEESNSGEVRFLAFWTNARPNETWTKSQQWNYNIYLQDLDGHMPAAPDHTHITYDTNDAWDQQTPPSIVGFTLKETTHRERIGTFDNGCQIHEINFYYERNNYKLELYNRNQHWGEADIPFEMKIGDLIFRDIDEKMIPKYPETLEEGAYFFEGWYTTADCTEGSGYSRRDTPNGKWRTGYAYFNEMGAQDLILYANWEPVQHEVRFFQTYDKMLDYGKSGDDEHIFITTTNGVPHDKVFSIKHGNVVGTIDFPTYEENGKPLDFKGWFYMKDGVKTMFTPADMPVTHDLELFADWGSHIPQPFRIQYMEYGTENKVADDTVGYAYQGSTRTFTPKTGAPFNQLYENYNSGWYPLLSSHSITIQAEEDHDNPVENVFTFYYVHTNNLPYMVRYVDKQTGAELGREVHETNTNAVVTERFKPFEGKVPDAFYKRLVLSVKFDEDGKFSTEPEDNVITFYYVPSTTTAFYAVHYMLQKPGTTGGDADDYVESDIFTEGTGDIGTQITISPIAQTGYTMSDEAVVVHGGDNSNPEHPSKQTIDGRAAFQFKLNQNGSELFVYYRLNKYDYTVKYLEYGAGKEVHEPKTVQDKEYGTVVQESAVPVNTYTALDPTTKSLTIRDHEADSGKEDPNVIIFYYVPLTYVAEYRVAAGGGGTLDNYGGKAVANAEGEYHFKGSLPMPETGFVFVGWYKDTECTVPADNGWVDSDNRLIPKIADMKPEPAVNIYYAKFDELKGDLTITRQGAQDEGSGEQVFVYKVQNKADPGLTIYVSITGQGSETIHGLRYGDYTIAQMNDWSWRYSDEAKEVTHQNSTTPVEFGKAADEEKWLNGNSAVKTNVKGAQR